jgi:hypothetical protein
MLLLKTFTCAGAGKNLKIQYLAFCPRRSGEETAGHHEGGDILVLAEGSQALQAAHPNGFLLICSIQVDWLIEILSE